MKDMGNIGFTSPQTLGAITSEGYCRLPVLPVSITERLTRFYESLPKPYTQGFVPSMFLPDSGLKATISHEICDALQPYLSAQFQGFKALYGNFMVKMPGAESNMKLHQDWAYVQEPGSESYALWFPLVDLDADNGALYMVPRSHQFKNTVRGPGVYCPFAAHEAFIKQAYGKPLYLKTGEPAFWQHRLLHYSPPNRSALPRVAVTVILVPDSEMVYHYRQEPGNLHVDRYRVNPEFYFGYNVIDMTDAHAVWETRMDAKPQDITRDELERVLGTDVPKRKWWQVFA